MRLGFDLDGVVVNINTALLRLIDLNKNLIDEHNLLLDIYYRNCKNILNPYNLMHENDHAVFITARPIELQNITKRWQEKYYPNIKLIMVGQNPIPQHAANFDFKKWQDDIVERKYKAIIDNNIDIYFDDNPSIIEGLRNKGITAVQIGGRI